ncbi:MAG TPA: DUF1579 family protein [bacterium]|nr:DUF1579 family protein [bacterium]
MRSTLTLLALTICTLLAASVHAEEATSAAAGPTPAEMEAIMAAYMEAATPGPEHAKLAEMAGTYSCTTKMRMDPNGEWMESTATETIEPMLGGRFLHMHVVGAPGPMMPEGFEGAGIFGYNNGEKRYEQVWVDTMGTLTLFMTGTADDQGVITLEGSYTCPYMKIPLHQRWVMHPSKDGFMIEMYGPDMSGNEYHMGTVTGVRK